MPRSRFAFALRTALIFNALLALPGFYALACANSSNIVDNTTGSGGAGGMQSVCILHNCQSDMDCAACSEGRILCNQRAHLCVACNVQTGDGCSLGETCSQFGSCVPMGVTCPADPHGVPTIACAKDADCAACNASHQVCDMAKSKCVACTPINPAGCQMNETCTTADVCQATCPASCGVNADCTACDKTGQNGYVCTKGKCVTMIGNDGGPPPPPPTDGGPPPPPVDAGPPPDDGGPPPVDAGPPPPDDGGPTFVCHDTCTIGPFMDPSCDSCTSMVCAADSFCCMTAWDTVCVSEVPMYCGTMCGCSHSECAMGAPLPTNCSPCATKVCAADSFCCMTMWDSVCVSEVFTYCGVTC